MMKRHYQGRLRAGIAISLVLVGCDQPSTASISDEPSVASAAITALGGRTYTYEAGFAALSAEVPASAGYVYDPDGVLVVVLSDSTDRGHVAAAVASLRKRGILPSDSLGMSTEIRVRAGRYTFTQLTRWRELFVDSLRMQEDGLAWLDLDEGKNQIAIGITGDVDRARGRVARLMAVGGIPQQAVSIQPTNRAKLDQGGYGICDYLDPPRAGLRSKHRPVVGGVLTDWASGGSCGTVGFIADLTASGQTKRYLVSNSHLSAGLFKVDGRILYQPTPDLSGSLAATETIDPLLYSCAPGWSSCRESEFALYEVAAGVSADRGQIARTEYAGSNGNIGSILLDPSLSFTVTRAGGAIVQGMTVEKMGVATGWTSGVVTRTCVLEGIEDEFGIIRAMPCQHRATYRGDGGDSGSPIFHRLSSEAVELEGLHWTHYSTAEAVFSGYRGIEKDLGVSGTGALVATTDITLAAPRLDGEVDSAELPVLKWNAVAGAQRYLIYRWHQYAFQPGTNPVLVAEVAGTTYTDFDVTSPGYAGAGQPNSSIDWSGYRVTAYSKGVNSDSINDIYFLGAPAP